MIDNAMILAQAVDSTSVQFAAGIGGAVSTLVLSGLGVANKYVTSLAIKVFQWKDTVLTSKQKALLALGWSNGVVLLNVLLDKIHMPFLPTNIDNVPTYLGGTLLVWLTSMGWHGLSKTTGLDKVLKIST